MKAPHDTDRWSRLQLFTVLDDSNDAPDGYRAGQIVYVDPDIEPVVGRDAVATLPEGHVLGRLQEDADGRYLLLLNPTRAERMVRLPAGLVCRGTVVGVFTSRDGDEGTQAAAVAALEQPPGAACCRVGRTRPDGAYVLRLDDDSMRPGIKRGQHVAVEPGGQCVVGEYVALYLRDGRCLVRELVTDGAAEVVVEAVNGRERLTIERADIEAIQSVAAIVSAQTVAEAFGDAGCSEAGR